VKAKVYITLKQGVLDPQGKAVQHSLTALGFQGVQDVRIGKYVELKLNHADRPTAEEEVKQMCEKLLANTVIESYRYELE
jgi:phosphoribosylformylglycinamidine synthase